MVTGVMARATLVRSIYKRGVNLTGKARMKISNSDLMNHISTDVRYLSSRIYLQLDKLDLCSRSAESTHALSGL
jgi:hypothetical protein